MNLPLAANRDEVLTGLSTYFSDGATDVPTMLLILLGVAALIVGGGYFVVWFFRRGLQPSSSKLLRLLGDSLGLMSAHRRLLLRIGQTAEIEPAVALLSPRLLAQMVHRSEELGLVLAPKQQAVLGQVVDAVAAGAAPQPPADSTPAKPE